MSTINKRERKKTTTKIMQMEMRSALKNSHKAHANNYCTHQSRIVTAVAC